MIVVSFLLLSLGALLAAAADEVLDVHIVSHTHDDVGWLKTVDQYYYGDKQQIQDAGVQYIIDEMVEALRKDPARRFVYVEMAFFTRWWREQTNETQSTVRDLVRNGQLEFVNGGWVMNDEATTQYEAVIDQMTRGHAFLRETFNVTPRIGWHIDPFGHSAAQARLCAEFGFDAFFFARIDYQDYDVRNVSKRLQVVWRQADAPSPRTDMFTHALYDSSYGWPAEFIFEWAVATPMRNDRRLFGYNVDERAEAFAKYMRAQAADYRTNQVLVVFGSDFLFQNAHVNFKNMDVLIQFLNENTDKYGLRVRYSTLSEYVDAVHASDETFPVMTGDFFPYADRPHAYWTGYFTSRAALKGYVRSSNALLQAARTLVAIGASALQPPALAEALEQVDVLQRAMAVAQHHDAVAGTEKLAVARDYARRLAEGAESAIRAVNTTLTVLMNASTPIGTFTHCPLLNQSVCEPLANSIGRVVPVVIFNPLATARDEIVRLPVPVASVVVRAGAGGTTTVPIEVLDNADTGLYTVVFRASLPPLAITTFFVDLSLAKRAHHSVPRHLLAAQRRRRMVSDAAAQQQQQATLETSTLRADFAGARLTSITYKPLGLTVNVTIDMMWYNSSTTNHSGSAQPGGAYIFRPQPQQPFLLKPQYLTVRNGSGSSSLLAEVVQRFTDWCSITYRLYEGADFVETETEVGEIPIADKWGKNVVKRVRAAEFKSGGAIATDAQGLQMMPRQLNQRANWPLKVNEPVAGNYYPKGTAAYIEEATSSATTRRRLTLITDRASGVASLGDGLLETMVHRRLLVDDERGVGEPLNQTDTVRVVDRLLLSSSEQSPALQRAVELRLNHPLQYFFPAATGGAGEYGANVSHVPVQSALPANVQLQTLAAQADGSLLVRVHYHADVPAKPATVNLAALLMSLGRKTPLNATEMTLSANQPLASLQRLKWKTEGSASRVGGGIHIVRDAAVDLVALSLAPLEIRTFVIA